MDRETKMDLMFDNKNKQWRFGRLLICYGYTNGMASFMGGFKFMWLKKNYEEAMRAKAKKLFPRILEDNYMK